LSLFLYNLFIFLYVSGIRCYSFINDKAKKWIDGRKKWQQVFREKLSRNEKRIWLHCSSLGEFEQGRPLIEALKEKYPNYKIVLTFFSPSGFEVRKNYDKADYIFYLPMDSKKNAQEFISLVKPSLAVFVKYEFWYYYLNALQEQKIPTIIISAAFRKEQPFFKWYGNFFRKMLYCYDWIFAQDENSQQLLKGIGFENDVSISGDTRYDRVSSIAANRMTIPVVEKFKDNNKLIIAGSTWPEDEKILKESIDALPVNWKLIIAPHEIDEAHIQNISVLFINDMVLFSELQEEQSSNFNKKILVINNIGLLSSLYAYGEIAFIGGGFNKGGIHNILEPAVFGLPVIFGPVYEKFVEAKKMADLHCAFPVVNINAYKKISLELMTKKDFRERVHNDLVKFMQENTGATLHILSQIERQRWLF
jgi:3-deoxy-D-manno-octulosonic-acid transferase